MSDDRLTLTCPNCSARMAVAASAAGKRVRCPKCQTAFAAEAPPATEPDAAPSDAGFDHDILAGLASGTAVDSPDDRHARQDEVAATRARARVSKAGSTKPRAARSGSNGSAWAFNFGRALLPKNTAGRLSWVALAAGCAVFVQGLREFELSSRTKAEPQTISCQKFITEGASDNLHIILTDFVLLPNYVCEQGAGKWKGAWTPAIPREVVDPLVAETLKLPPSKLSTITPAQRFNSLYKLKTEDFDFKLIVSFPQADGEQYMERILEGRTLQGTISPDGLRSLTRRDRDRRELLHGSFPRINLDTVPTLIVGRAPSSAALASTYLFGGPALVLIVLLLAARRAARATG